MSVEVIDKNILHEKLHLLARFEGMYFKRGYVFCICETDFSIGACLFVVRFILFTHITGHESGLSVFLAPCGKHLGALEIIQCFPEI